MIEMQQVTFTYPGATTPALHDVSLTVPAGQFCAVIGASGAGKSTLAYAIAGLVPHFYQGTMTGEVRVAGRAAALNQLATIVGLLFQNPLNQLSNTKFTVRDEIAFGLENLGVPRADMTDRIEAALRTVGIHDLAARYPLTLSGGQLQRVALASVLAMQPQVLVLDEPTTQLDPIGSREVFAAIGALAQTTQTTVILIEHKLEWIAAYADRVVALAKGRIVADNMPREVLTDESLLAHGLGQTRYTQVARQARARGWWPPDRALPVTLAEAVHGLKSS